MTGGARTNGCSEQKAEDGRSFHRLSDGAITFLLRSTSLRLGTCATCPDEACRSGFKAKTGEAAYSGEARLSACTSSPGRAYGKPLRTPGSTCTAEPVELSSAKTRPPTEPAYFDKSFIAGSRKDFPPMFRRAVIRLDPVSIRIDDECGVIVEAVDRARTRRTVVLPARAQRCGVKGIDRL